MSHANPIGPDDGLMPQEAAREEAKELNAAGRVPVGLVAIAVPYPRDSWGGQEKGWTVAYEPKMF